MRGFDSSKAALSGLDVHFQGNPWTERNADSSQTARMTLRGIVLQSTQLEKLTAKERAMKQGGSSSAGGGGGGEGGEEGGEGGGEEGGTIPKSSQAS